MNLRLTLATELYFVSVPPNRTSLITNKNIQSMRKT